MNIKQSFAIGFTASLFLSLSLTSCKKDSNSDSDAGPAQDNSVSESNYNDVNTMVDGAYSAGTNYNFRASTGARQESIMSGCTTVTVDSVSTARKITIDFGTTNCMGLDGRNRRGKINATWSGKFRDSNTVISITFDNYFVNDNKIAGTHKTTNMGRNAAGHQVIKTEVSGQVTRADSSGTIFWSSVRFREVLEGASTPLNFLDDVYSITGKASGTNKDGKSYTAVITQALIRKMNCRWFESGKVDITPVGGNATRTLDYGSTGCDANATVTIGGHTTDVVLP